MRSPIEKLISEVDKALNEGLSEHNLRDVEGVARALREDEFTLRGRPLQELIDEAIEQCLRTGQPAALTNYEVRAEATAVEDCRSDALTREIMERLATEDAVHILLTTRRVWSSEPDYPHATTDAYGNFVNTYVVVGTLSIAPTGPRGRVEYR
jgi:hypothetical protein